MSTSPLLRGTTSYGRQLTAWSIVASIIILFSAEHARGQGDLLISPLRVVFEGPKKSQEISLANVGKDTATFAVSVVNIRMNEDGSFDKIDSPDAGQNFADKYLRFFPRKVTLAPNESQVVKVQVMNASQMAPGEYRSHLYFRAVPDEKPLGDNGHKKDTGGISISLTPIFGITTPVIIRVGENTTTASLSDVFFEMHDGKPTMGMTFNRNGNMSVYGDLTISYTAPAGVPIQVKLVKGVGVYTPGTKRRFKVELDDDKNIDFHKGKLHVTYTLQTSDKTEKTAEADVELK